MQGNTLSVPFGHILDENIIQSPPKSHAIKEGDSQLRVTTKKNFNVNVPQKGRDFSSKKESLTQADDLTKFDDNTALSHY